MLSLWLTEGKRKDLFCRTVLSGGQHTVSEGKKGTPGDLMANHPEAFDFMSLFSIEAKHHKSIDLDKYLWDQKQKTFLSLVVKKAVAQASKLNLNALVVAKQNYYPAIILMQYHVGVAALHASIGLKFHILHSNSMMMVLLEEFLAKVHPLEFLRLVKGRDHG